MALRNPAIINALAHEDMYRDPNAIKVFTWLHLSQYPDYASYNDLKNFLTVNPGWPKENLLLLKLEEKMPAGLRPYDIKNWFDGHPPRTGRGLILYLNALHLLGFHNTLKPALRTFWYENEMSDEDRAAILGHYGRLLSEQDHINRASALIWAGKMREARKVFPLISPEKRSVLNARILLATQAPGVDNAVAQVPQGLRNDPGLVYERVRWRRRAGLDDRALSLLNATGVDQSLHPDKWWTERHILIRRAIENGDWKKALSIARKHRQNTGLGYSQAEFLVGWMTMNLEHNPDHAARVFTRLYDAVGTPMSLTRAAYWAGRAYDMKRDTVHATLWYQKAADHAMFFYGQLANSRLGHKRLDIDWVALNLQLAESSPLKFHPFASAIRIFNNAHLPEYHNAFLFKLLNEAKTEADFHYVASLARAVNRHDFAIRSAKEMYNKYNKMLTVGYPDLPHLTSDVSTKSHLLGIIRQESIFNPTAGSHAGAKGLMQLMPATAKETARKIGISYSYEALTRDPAYNTRLGAAYMDRMLRYYDGNFVLATAAYNAGFGRVNGWIKTFGDPRAPDIDIVDWIESLPVYETRNYIQRVLEATRVYEELFRAPKNPLLGSNRRL